MYIYIYIRTCGIFILALSDILSGICFDILFDILSGIYSDILSGILSDILSGVWLRSGSAQWDLALAVQAQQCPLRSGARGWGSGSAHGWGGKISPNQLERWFFLWSKIHHVEGSWFVFQYVLRSRCQLSLLPKTCGFSRICGRREGEVLQAIEWAIERFPNFKTDCPFAWKLSVEHREDRHCGETILKHLIFYLDRCK